MARNVDASFGEKEKELQQLLRQAGAGKTRPVYLFAGEPSLTTAAARQLVDVLVPESSRSFNLEMYDGRTTPLGRILDSLRMSGFLAGTKVVWLRETTIFLSGEKKTEITGALLEAIRDGQSGEAAEKLLTLVALAGWTQAQFAEAQWTNLPKTRVKDVFGEELDAAQLGQLAAVQAWCVSRDLSVREFRDEGAELLGLLEEGLPSSVVLLLTASTVDARKKIFKTIAEVGSVLDLAVKRERSGALDRETVEGLVASVLGAAGKQMEAPARELIVRRAGADTALLGSELEKLCLYIGDRESITADDVRRIVPDLTASWVFDFTASLAARQLGPALALLRGLLGQGEPALKVLATIVREVRLLLLARECLETSLRGVFSPGLSYPAFQSRALPRIDAETMEALGKTHPYVLYKHLQDAGRFRTSRLRKAMLQLSEIDARLKSTRTDPGILLEAFVISWCGTTPERR